MKSDFEDVVLPLDGKAAASLTRKLMQAQEAQRLAKQKEQEYHAEAQKVAEDLFPSELPAEARLKKFDLDEATLVIQVPVEDDGEEGA